MWWTKKNEKLASGSKNTINPEQYDSILTRITELRADISTLKTDAKNQQTEIDNLRGKFNRKLRGLEVEEEKRESKDEPKTINTNEYVAFG